MRPFALLLFLSLLGVAPARPAAADKPEALAADVSRVEADIAGLEVGTSELEQKYRNAPAETFQHSLQRRLMDAMLMYEFKSYEKAVVLFAELIRIPEFKSDRDYWQVVFYLAESLHRLGNHNSAAHYFGSIVDGNVPAFSQPALGHLLDIAMATRNYQMLNRYYRVLDAVPAGQRTSALVYAYGKALYFQGGLDDAIVELSRIPAGDPFHARALYYIGVARSRQADYANALTVFRGATEAAKAAASDDDRDVRDLAFMALGRLLEETGQLLDAVNAYQEIARYSPHYETSLYEMTWAFVKMAKFDRALRTLDTLILVVEDDDLRIQANTLRGRLSIYLKRFDEADDAYESVVQQFTPLKNELLAFMEERKNVTSFFAWLMTAEQESSPRPLSVRAIQWMAADQKMTELLSVFTDIRGQKREVDEFERLIFQLRARLDSDSAIETFPNLAEAWYAVIEVENRLLRARGTLLDAERKLLKPSLAAADRDRLEPLWQERERLEQRFAKMPVVAADYTSRRSSVSRTFDRYDAELTILEQTLQEQIRDADIMYEWAVRDSTGPDGRRRGTNAQENQRLETLSAERDRLASLSPRIRAAREGLEVSRVVAGAGDDVMRSEAALKKALVAAQGAEAGAYVARRSALGADAAAVQARAAAVHDRVVRTLDRLSAVRSVLLLRTHEKVTETRRLVDAEETEVRSYKARLASAETKTMSISEQVGSTLFALARDQIRETVLEADLGLIDIAWQKKQDVTGEIQSLNEARLNQIQQIDENLKGILEK